MSINSIESQLKLAKRYIKLKLVEDNVTFRGHNLEKSQVYDLVKRTIVNGESHSALIIGPRGSGKTCLINSVLSDISKLINLSEDAIVIRLHGLLHHDEKVALQSITKQMQLENAVGDRVFGSFAENLSFLLSCLQSVSDRSCKSMVFVLDDFDMFCRGEQTQTLLYNLFDITHNKQAPMCVLGLSTRLDGILTMEKRVKSRFSHRHIYLLKSEQQQREDNTSPKPLIDTFIDLFIELLSLPKMGTGKTKRSRRKEQQYSVPKEVLARCCADGSSFDGLSDGFVQDWNEHWTMVSGDDTLVDAVDRFLYYTVNEQLFKEVLFRVVSTVSPSHPKPSAIEVASAIEDAVTLEHRAARLQSLSILQLSLVIAMKKGMEIFDGEPMNFEMVLHRYTKFANSVSSTHSVSRLTALKAFERLQALEIIAPVRGDTTSHHVTTSGVQKEYQLFTLAVSFDDITEALNGLKVFPTEIRHWYNSII